MHFIIDTFNQLSVILSQHITSISTTAFFALSLLICKYIY